jgi:uncharacterized protein YndB with AHSA1/START domain
MTQATGSITTVGKHGIIITHVFDAPRELVFRAYTEPGLIVRWWGPRKYTTTIDKMDARSGGAWRFLQRGPDGDEHAFHGVYHLVERPGAVIQTFEWEGLPGHVSLDSAVFEETGGKTRVTSTSVFQTPEDRDGMMQSGMEEGVNEGAERMAELLRTLR